MNPDDFDPVADFLPARHSTQLIIKLAEPLPCGTAAPIPDNPAARCNNPATVAYAYPAAEDSPNLPHQPAGIARPGEWIVLPVCRECVKRSLSIYRGTTDDRD